MNTAIPPTVAGAQPLSRRSRLLSMVDKNLVADKGPSVLVPASTNCDGMARTSLKCGEGIQGCPTAVASSFVSRLMVGAA
jgi:hypothetical protein